MHSARRRPNMQNALNIVQSSEYFYLFSIRNYFCQESEHCESTEKTCIYDLGRNPIDGAESTTATVISSNCSIFPRSDSTSLLVVIPSIARRRKKSGFQAFRLCDCWNQKRHGRPRHRRRMAIDHRCRLLHSLRSPPIHLPHHTAPACQVPRTPSRSSDLLVRILP